ncbi:Uma2 family endonuclease [Microbispora sp. H10670]|uniref:Uma2 family endonuclease n=1 Tax=Microbispora sp. H10670 TaxID=2729108 RepID=UPI00160287CD|nr:Uma2 family endonuclease [Microbispora sp. H10670]
MSSAPGHRPPGEWTADDLDHLPTEGPNGEPDLFTHVELIDGALVLAAPQRRLHQRLIQGLIERLDAQAPAALAAVHRMDVKLGDRTRPCPDVMLIDTEAGADMSRTFYAPREVHLVVEIVSPESVERDRKLKPARYAEAGIPHFWRIEEHDGRPVVYVYERDPATGAYTPTGIHHGRLTVPVPFPIEVDLDQLVK